MGGKTFAAGRSHTRVASRAPRKRREQQLGQQQRVCCGASMVSCTLLHGGLLIMCICFVLQLAPGGHVGRFIVWTKSAFEKLDSVFGTTSEVISDTACCIFTPVLETHSRLCQMASKCWTT